MLDTSEGYKLELSPAPKGLRSVKVDLGLDDFVKCYLKNIGNATHWKTASFHIHEEGPADDIAVTIVPRMGYKNVRFAQGKKGSMHLLMPVDHGAAIAIAHLTFSGSWSDYLATLWKTTLEKNKPLTGCRSLRLPPGYLVNQAARVLHDTIGANSDNILNLDAKEINFSELFYVPFKTVHDTASQTECYLTKAAVTIEKTEHVIAGMYVKSNGRGITYDTTPAADGAPDWRHRAADIAQGWSPERS